MVVFGLVVVGKREERVGKKGGKHQRPQVGWIGRVKG